MVAIERFFYYIENKGLKHTPIEKALGLSNGYLGKMKLRKASIGSEIIEKIVSYFPDLNINWLITGKGEMEIVEKKETQKTIEETRPRIPINAAAGSLSNALDGVTIDKTEQIPIIKAFSKYDFTIFARGNSMEPEFYSGDELACLYLKATDFIQWGRYHVLDTMQGVLVKRIYEDGNYIICKSDNLDYYKDFKIHKSEIYNIALVVGCIRRY